MKTKEQKRREASERAAKYLRLTAAEKLDKLNGPPYREAAKQRARLKKMMKG